MKRSVQILGILFFVFICLALRPITQATPENCYMVQGELLELVPNENSKDIGIRIKNDKKHYYINRGLEKAGLLSNLEELSGKTIKLYPIEHWTPLDPTNSVRHIAHIEFNHEIIYSEYEGS